MTKNRYLGVYMDHSKAHLIEIVPGGFDARRLDSAYTHQLKREELSESELHQHNTAHHLETTYYKELGDIFRQYHEVLLFGPTTAKNELHNHLKANHLFNTIKIEVKDTDKLTENQQDAFVRDYFSIKNV